MDRKGKHPAAHLAGYKDIVRADGFTGFNGLSDGAVMANRVDITLSDGRRIAVVFEQNGSTIARGAIERIAKLYAVEKEARHKSPDERVALRQTRATPIFEELEIRMKSQCQNLGENQTGRDHSLCPQPHTEGASLS